MRFWGVSPKGPKKQNSFNPKRETPGGFLIKITKLNNASPAGKGNKNKILKINFFFQAF